MKKILLILLCLQILPAAAVHVNHQGLGDVLIVPYYTVNNDLNTLVSVTNPTATSKAIKINIREGLLGHAVLSYNVYLNAYDTWTFAFVPSTSSVAGFTGQDSAIQISSDNSCAPFLAKSGQEFLPFEFSENPQDSGPEDLSRAREGYIEILEMGELQGDFIAAAQHGFNDGVPADCAAFEAAWLDGGVWNTESGGDVKQDITTGSGGLMAQADIINVSEGINFSIPVFALADFFAADTINHVDPGDTGLSLDAAAPMATIITGEKTYQMAFDTGVDAVSAVFMADELIGTFALDSIVDGKSETVFIQPTLRFYFANSFPHGGLCTEIEQDKFNREGRIELSDSGRPGILPPEPPTCLYGSVFVQYIELIGSFLTQPEITQSNNYSGLTSPYPAESGFIRTRFTENSFLIGTDVNSGNSVYMMGSPVIGFALQQFTNANAADGLLAQYGGAHKIISKIRMFEQ